MPTENRPMLWTCDLLPFVRIVGSIHFLEEGAIPPWLDDCLRWANAVVIEFDRETYEPPPTFAPGLDVAAPDIWALVASTAYRLGASDIESLRGSYPFAASHELTRLKLESVGLSFQGGVETYVLERAQIVLGLEKFPEFYAIVYRGPGIETQIGALQQGLDHLPELPHRIRAAVTAWQVGDGDRILEELQFRELGDSFPEIGRALFKTRHEVWLSRLERYVVKASELGHRLLVVVGAAHLVGQYSLLRDIENQWGCRFEQVSGWPSRDAAGAEEC